MNETSPAALHERATDARALARAIDADPAGIAGALFALLDATSALWAVKDVTSGRYVQVNPAMAQLLGRTTEALLGATDADCLPPAQAGAIRVAEQAALAHGGPMTSEHRVESGGRKREFGVVRLVLPRADGGAARHLLSVWTDRTAAGERQIQLQQALAQLEQQQAASETLRREAQEAGPRDSDGTLYQRAQFDDQLRRELDLSSREHREFALVSIVLDPFSDAVQALGDEARGRVLDALGRLLRSNTRAMDAACRLDADRFAVLLSGVGLATAHSRMEGLRRQCATQIVMLDGRDLGFTVSMGVASFPHTAHTEGDLLQAAETALREARRRGGNHVALASIRFEPGAS